MRNGHIVAIQVVEVGDHESVGQTADSGFLFLGESHSIRTIKDIEIVGCSGIGSGDIRKFQRRTSIVEFSYTHSREGGGTDSDHGTRIEFAGALIVQGDSIFRGSIQAGQNVKLAIIVEIADGNTVGIGANAVAGGCEDAFPVIQAKNNISRCGAIAQYQICNPIAVHVARDNGSGATAKCVIDRIIEAAPDPSNQALVHENSQVVGGGVVCDGQIREAIPVEITGGHGSDGTSTRKNEFGRSGECAKPGAGSDLDVQSIEGTGHGQITSTILVKIGGGD